MKLKKLSIVVSILFMVVMISGFRVHAQESNSFHQSARLAALAKVWGFLKYYHPGVAAGKVEWDRILLESVEPVKAAGTIEAFNDLIQDIIREAGNVNLLHYPYLIPGDTVDDPDFQWIRDGAVFTWYTIFKLEAVKQFYRPAANVYVNYNTTFGNVSLDGEKGYGATSYPSEAYRLLALFRYWNVIHYFFPSKNLTGENWEAVLTEFIPVFIDAGSVEEYHLAVQALTTRIKDSHATTASSVLTDLWGTLYHPFYSATIEGNIVVTDVYDNLLPEPDALQAGDVILEVDGVPVETRIQQLRSYLSASTESAFQLKTNYYLFHGSAPQLTLTFRRSGEIRTVTLSRYEYERLVEEEQVIPKGDIWKILDGNIGYIDMERLEEQQVFDAMMALMDTRAIIFDVRGYPNETLYTVCNYLNPDSRDFIKFTRPDPVQPGKFEWTPTLQVGPPNYNSGFYKGKVVILVNEWTRSRSEFTVMGLQASPDAVVIGSETSGAIGNVSRVRLPGGIETAFSGMGVYYPDGRQTQQVGIVPDIYVAPTIQGIREGRDEILERAVEFINNSTN